MRDRRLGRRHPHARRAPGARITRSVLLGADFYEEETGAERDPARHRPRRRARPGDRRQERAHRRRRPAGQRRPASITPTATATTSATASSSCPKGGTVSRGYGLTAGEARRSEDRDRALSSALGVRSSALDSASELESRTRPIERFVPRSVPESVRASRGPHNSKPTRRIRSSNAAELPPWRGRRRAARHRRAAG